MTRGDAPHIANHLHQDWGDASLGHLQDWGDAPLATLLPDWGNASLAILWDWGNAPLGKILHGSAEELSLCKM